MASEKKSDFNYNIHGLRGIAALLVCVLHIKQMACVAGMECIREGSTLGYVINSFLASVDIFFMISGYLICASLLKWNNVRLFLTERVIRVYPVFLLLHCVLFIVAPFIHYKWLAGISLQGWLYGFVTNLFLLPGLTDLPTIQPVAWSLSYEFMFYFFSAAVFLTWERWRGLSYLLLGLGLPVILHFYPRAIYFLIGSIVFLAKDRVSAAWVRAIGLWCIIPFGFFMVNVEGWELKPTVLAAAPFGMAFFIAVVNNKGALFLQSRFMQFMGTISYSFYLWHSAVAFPIKRALDAVMVKYSLSPVLIVSTFTVILIPVAIFISYWSYELLEKRLAKYLKDRFIYGSSKTVEKCAEAVA